MNGSMQKHREITMERIQKFMQSGQFDDVNIRPTLYGNRAGVDQGVVSLQYYPAPGLERITFEDAVKGTYKPVKAGLKIGPTWSTHWFKVHITVPNTVDFRGNPIWFTFDAGCEAMIWSESGAPITGLTGTNGIERHVHFSLTNKAKGGDSFFFYVEVACNELFGASGVNPPDMNRTFIVSTVEIVVPHLEAFSLFWDMEILNGMIRDTPADTQLNNDALYMANKIANTLNYKEPATVTSCKALTDAWFKDRQKVGSALHKIIAVGNCHIDTAWLWTYDETKRKAARSWSRQIQFMETYPEFVFTASQAQQFEWVEKLYPKLFDQMLAKAQKGQFVPVGGTWVEMDCNIPSGESFCRQFLYGQRYFESRFGSRSDVFWLPDTFGYSAQLPQIVKQSDMKYFFTQKLSWNNINKFPHTSFYWAGLDGSQYVAQGSVKDVNFAVQNNKDKAYSNKSLILFGNGDGGGGPLIPMIERLKRMKHVEGLAATVEFGSASTFYKELEKTSKDLIVWEGELYFELHRGTYTTHALMKKYNRFNEISLRDAELLIALNSLLGSSFGNPKDELDECWKKLLLNQFHDVLPGSSIEMVYTDATKFHEEIAKSSLDIRRRALKSLLIACKFNLVSRPLSLKDNKVLAAIPVLNTTSWTRRNQIIEIDSQLFANLDGITQLSEDKSKVLAIIEEISPMSLTLQDISMQLPKSALLTVDAVKDSQGYVVSNNYITATFDVNARLVSLIDKSGREIITPGQPANMFRYFEDIPFYWDAWDVEIYHLEKGWNAGVGKVELVENGPIRVVLKVIHPISSTSTLEQRIIITAASPRIDFETEVLWDENRKILKVEFPVNIKNDHATYETQFGYIQRPTHFNTSWDLAKFEVCGHKFVDYSEYGYGVTILNDCKYGFSVHANVMRMSLLRSPKMPDLHADMGRHTFKYALLPHSGSFETNSQAVQAGYEFNIPLTIADTFVTPGSSMPLGLIDNVKDSSQFPFFQLDQDNVVLDTVKLAEPELIPFGSNSKSVQVNAKKSGKWVLVRLYESMGGRGSVTLSCIFDLKRAYLSNILEDVLDEIPVENGSITIPYDRFKIISILLCF